jgi:cytochrome c biogenesis protein
VELGGLARTDQAGYGEEFDRLRHDLLEADVLPDAAPTRRDEHAQGDHGGTG